MYRQGCSPKFLFAGTLRLPFPFSSLIIIIIIPGQCLWCCHHAVAALREFTLVHAMRAARCQVAADLWTKPIGLNHKPACRLPVNYTHHRHFIITISPKADTHFTIPRKVEGWVDLEVHDLDVKVYCENDAIDSMCLQKALDIITNNTGKK